MLHVSLADDAIVVLLLAVGAVVPCRRAVVRGVLEAGKEPEAIGAHGATDLPAAVPVRVNPCRRELPLQLLRELLCVLAHPATRRSSTTRRGQRTDSCRT